MEDLIFEMLEKSAQSLAVYEDMMRELDGAGDAAKGLNGSSEVMKESSGSGETMSSRRMTCQIIADNCIQMAALYWCKVFCSKKSKTHYASGMGSNKKLFLNAVEAKGISFQETCDKMRSFRDKYSEGKYEREEIRGMFQDAMEIAGEYKRGSDQ